MQLDGIRVLDLSRLLPGPYCSRLLADLGADVIKIESAEGDPVRAMPPYEQGESVIFAELCAGMRSVVLNLKDDAGREALLQLAESADVLIEGFRPGVMERLGLSWEVLHSRNQRLVVCSISGFGPDGPYRDRAGHDLTYLAAAGVLGITRCGEGRSAIPGVQIADLGGGAQNACIAILAALLEREHSGEGRHCEISMFDGAVSWASFSIAAGDAGAAGHLTGAHPCYAIYPCADGELAVAALEPRFWDTLVGELGLPELRGLGLSMGAEAEQVRETVAEVLRRRTAAEWMTILGPDTCVEPVRAPSEVHAHPQAAARGLVAERGWPRVRSPFGRRQGAVPVLGGDTASVLRECGFDPARLGQAAATKS